MYGCNPVTNSQAITCTNSATCSGNTCVCASNNTVGTLCEIRMLFKFEKKNLLIEDIGGFRGW